MTHTHTRHIKNGMYIWTGIQLEREYMEVENEVDNSPLLSYGGLVHPVTQ